MKAAIGNRPPPKASKGSPVKNTIAAPNPAPLAEPIRYGSAKGLRNKP